MHSHLSLDPRPEANTADLPVATLQTAARQADIPELDFWAMIQQDWQRQDETDIRRPENYDAAMAKQLEKTRTLLAHLQASPPFAAAGGNGRTSRTLAQQAESGAGDRAVLYLSCGGSNAKSPWPIRCSTSAAAVLQASAARRTAIW